MSSLNQMLVAVFCLLLLAGHAQASSYGYNCVVDGTLSVAGKSIRPLANGTGVILIDNGSTITVSSTYALTNASSGGVTLLAGSSPSQSILGLKSGTGISLVSNGNDVTIANTYALTNASSGGVTLLAGSSPSQSILGLKQGPGISLFSDGNDVTVSSVVNLTNVGGSLSLVNNSVGPSLAIKGLTAGSGIRISSSSTDLTISSDVNLTSTGGTYSLVGNSVGPSLSIKGLSAGRGISIDPSTGNSLILSSSTLIVYQTFTLAISNTSIVDSTLLFSPAASTSYFLSISLYMAIPNNVQQTVYLIATGSGSAGTLNCGNAAIFGARNSASTSPTFTAGSSANIAQSSSSSSSGGSGLFSIGCVYTSSSTVTSVRVQLQTASGSTTLFAGSWMQIAQL